jgi:hypothetical protein
LNEILVLVESRAGIGSKLCEEGAVISGQEVFRGADGWWLFSKNWVDAEGISGFIDYVGMGGYHGVAE